MKILVSCLIIFVALLLFIFRGFLNNVIEEMILPDQNSQLVNYLQGDWAVAEDQKFVFQIKRDSLIELYNFSINGVNSLHYLFSGAASKYFSKEGSFNFFSASKPINDFKLIAISTKTGDTLIHILNHVSKSRITMNSAGKSVNLVRISKSSF